MSPCCIAGTENPKLVPPRNLSWTRPRNPSVHAAHGRLPRSAPPHVETDLHRGGTRGSKRGLFTMVSTRPARFCDTNVQSAGTDRGASSSLGLPMSPVMHGVCAVQRIGCPLPKYNSHRTLGYRGSVVRFALLCV